MTLAQRLGQEFKSLRDNELTLKVDKVVGKQLSTEDYTTLEKTKLAGIEDGATVDRLTVLSFLNNILTYTDEDGTVFNLDLSTIQDLTTLTYLGYTLSYTDEDGVIFDIDLEHILTEAKTYTDTEVAALKLYTDTNKQDIAEKGVADGYASLDSAGLVPASQLPSFVDDVMEYADLATFPVSGETSKIYVALDTNLTYRWSGTVYVELTDTTAIWGGISGTLANQTDLQGVLDTKETIVNVDSKDTTTLNSANAYTDNELLSYTNTTDLTNALNLKETILNVDIKDSATLGTANTYTDTELLNYSDNTTLQAELDLKETILNVDSKDAATLASANSYTDTELLDYDTSTEVDTKLVNYDTSGVIDTKLSNYTTTTNLTSVLALKASLNENVSFDNITPETTELFDIGSSSLFWNNIFAKTLKPFYNGVDIEELKISGTNFVNLAIQTDKTGNAVGDPSISFEDTGSGNSWSLRNDTSDSNSFNIRYNNSSRFTINNSGNVDINGFTKLGNLPATPSIKTVKLTGTTGSAQGDSVNIVHNLTGDKIISFTLKIAQSTDNGVPAQFTGAAGFEASIFHNGTNFIVENISGNSASILSKPITIYVTYEE